MQNFPFGRELRSCVWAFIFATEEKLADDNLIDKCSVKSAAFFLVLLMSIIKLYIFVILLFTLQVKQ